MPAMNCIEETLLNFFQKRVKALSQTKGRNAIDLVVVVVCTSLPFLPCAYRKLLKS